jgi:hypothetical protein
MAMEVRQSKRDFIAKRIEETFDTIGSSKFLSRILLYSSFKP